MNEKIKLFEIIGKICLSNIEAAEYKTFIQELLDIKIVSREWKAFLIYLKNPYFQQKEGWAQVREEYNLVFLNSCGHGIGVWESVFKSEKRQLLDKHTLAVETCYENWDLKVNPERKQISDHIGIESGFLSYLYRRSTEKSLKDATIFLEEHFLVLIKGILSELESQKIGLLFYQGFFRLLLKACEADTLPNKTTQKFSNSEENHYFFVECNEKYLVEKEIKTGGRHNCGGRCSFLTKVTGDNVLQLKVDAKKTPSVKYCVRCSGYLSSFLSPRRIRVPLKRSGNRGEGKFIPITWEEAANTIAKELIRVKNQYGPEARYINYGSGVSGIMRPDSFAERLLSLDGGFLGKYNSYSSACASFITPYIYGTEKTGSTSNLLKESNLIILWGHNPRETIFGAYLMEELVNCSKNGTEIIVIDPRRSMTVDTLKADWIGIKPTTDAALADALAYVIFNEHLESKTFIDTYCIGFDEEHMPTGVPENLSVKAYLFGKSDGILKTPQWAEKITGIPADKIEWLARKLGTSKPAAILPGLGPQRHKNGEQIVRATAMLSCLTGNVGIKGGSAAGVDFIEGPSLPVFPAIKNKNQASIPSFLWTDAILRGNDMTSYHDGVIGKEKLDAPIKLILNLAGNTLVNQHGDVKKTQDILKDETLCEFIVVSDVFFTSSAKYADLLLPAPSFLESENIATPWREGDFIIHNAVVTKPLFESRFEFDWLKEVADKMGLYQEFIDGKDTLEEWLLESYNNWKEKEHIEMDYPTFSENGGYFETSRRQVIGLEKEIKNPSKYPFQTPSGKIEIFSKTIYEREQKELPGIPCYVPVEEGVEENHKYPLQLIGWHTRRRTHSIHDNNSWMDKIEKPMIVINPKDAKERNIEQNEVIKVENDRGCILIPAFITENIISGVVAIAQGGWNDENETREDKRGNINTLTSHIPSPFAKGNTQHTNRVELIKIS